MLGACGAPPNAGALLRPMPPGPHLHARCAVAHALGAEYDARLQGAVQAAAAAGVRLAPSPDVLRVIREADAFTFDVDSTL